VTTRACYSLQSVSDSGTLQLEGTYFEYPADADADDVTARSNEMRVQVDFADDAHGERGSFKLGRRKPAVEDTEWDEAADETPTPAVLVSSARARAPAAGPALREVFEFDFSSRQDGAFQISESRWLGLSGGLIQMVLLGDDAFIISQVSSVANEDGAVTVSSWTALRRRAKPAAAAAVAAAAPPARKTLLQRWGFTVSALVLLLGYQVYKKQ